jgi:hypothetical protein
MRPAGQDLATSPNLTGSSPTLNTVGIVVVAALAASAATLPAGVTIAATRRAREVSHECREAIEMTL